MKTLLKFLFVLPFVQTVWSQNFVQGLTEQPTCFNSCNGSVVFTTTVTAGPFTATLSNGSSCSNAIQQTSTSNTITISNICACAGVYTVNFYNSSSVLVGSELLQIPITATAPLVVTTPTINPAVCSTCCNGEVYINWTGGYTPSPNNPTITIDAVNIGTASYPNASVCPGSHTVCVRDLAGCVVCSTFSMTYVTHVGLIEINTANLFELYPNPANSKITVSCIGNSDISRILIYDVYGKILLDRSEVKLQENKTELSIEHLDKGVYFIELRKTNGDILNRKKFIRS